MNPQPIHKVVSDDEESSQSSSGIMEDSEEIQDCEEHEDGELE